MPTDIFSPGSTASIPGYTMSLGGGPAFALISATSVDSDIVNLLFSNPVDTSNSLLFLPSSYAVNNGLFVISVIQTGPATIQLTTSAQSDITYSVTVNTGFTDVFLQTLTNNYASWTGNPVYIPPFVVSNLNVETECVGLALYLTWTNPTSSSVTSFKIVRRTRSWPFDLTDNYDLVFEDDIPLEQYISFIDTGVKMPITFLTSPVSAGSTTINVVSATGVEVGMIIKLETLSGQPNNELVTVSHVSGNTVTLTGGTDNAYSVGDRVAQSSPLQPQTYYYYLVLVSNSDSSPFSYPIEDGSRAFGLSIDQWNSLQFFINNTPRIALAKDALPVSQGGGGGFLMNFYQVMGCWLNLNRGVAAAIQLINNSDTAPYNVLAAQNLSLGIEPEGLSYDFSIMRRTLSSLIYVYQRKGTCPGIIETVRMFTLWDAECAEFGIGGCNDGPVPVQTYDGYAQLQSGTFEKSAITEVPSTGVSVPPTPNYYISLPCTGINTHEFQGGTMWGPIGDIPCISDNAATVSSDTIFYMVPSVSTTTLTSNVSSGATSISVGSTSTFRPNIQIELRTANGQYGEVVEVSTVTPPNTLTLKTALVNSYSVGDSSSISKDIIRMEYLGKSGTFSGNTLTDVTSAWETNQWVGYQILSSTGQLRNVLSNTATFVTFDGASISVSNTGYSIAKQHNTTNFSARNPSGVVQFGTGTITRIYEPRFDQRELGTLQDPFNALYEGPGINVSGVWGPNDVGVYITTPVTVIGGKGTAVGNTLYLDPSAPTPAAGSLVGMYLNPNQNQEQLFEILSNTPTSLIVGTAIASLVSSTQYYYVLKPRDANRFTRLSDRLKTEFTDVDTDPHVLFY